MRVPSDIFSVRLEQSNGTARLHLTGRFDSAALPALDDRVRQVWRRDLLIDLEGVTFMDSAAWLAVVAYAHRVRAWGKDLRLVHAPPHIRRIFELTSTEHLLAEAVSA